MSTSALTPRQKEILEFLRRTVEKRGYPPSLRETASHFGIAGVHAVEKHLAALEQKGFLKKGVGPRAIELTERATARAVPIVGRVAAGRPILAEENRIGTLALDASVVRWKEAFLLKVKGESMNGAGILDGDLVLVKPQPDAESGEIVVALLDGEATVKRLIKKGGAMMLQPENPDFEPLAITRQSPAQIIGRIVGVFRF
ncbi:MAG: transcriptional repressor LexA [Nitrospirae bacterium]|nr:transcriptional repressor LexA [Candidatus Manganitrophaceae bacterium]